MRRRALVFPLLAALATVPACGGDDDTTPSTTVTSTNTTSTSSTTTVAMTPEQEVEAAYLRSWDVYAKAMSTADPSGLDHVFHGRALELRQQEIEDLRRENRRGRISVKHNYSISLIDDGGRALVLEAYENHSVLLDGQTGQPIEPDPNEIVRRRYVMSRIEGMWKVSEVVAL